MADGLGKSGKQASAFGIFGEVETRGAPLQVAAGARREEDGHLEAFHKNA